MKGMTADLYKNPLFSHCSNGGISETHDEVTVVGPEIPGIFEVVPDRPTVKIVPDAIGDGFHCEPVDPSPEGHTGYMFGGAFVYSSDSRWPTGKPMRLHDRTETWAQYEISSQ